MFKVLIEPFIKYSSAGGLATAIHYFIFLVVIYSTSWAPWQATFLGAAVGALVAYLLNYHFTFASSRRHQTLLPKFLVAAALGVLIQTVIVVMFTQHWHLYYLLAQLIATCLSLIITFLINNFWTFA